MESLGLGPAIAFSAAHNNGLGDLFTGLTEGMAKVLKQWADYQAKMMATQAKLKERQMEKKRPSETGEEKEMEGQLQIDDGNRAPGKREITKGKGAAIKGGLAGDIATSSLAGIEAKEVEEEEEEEEGVEVEEEMDEMSGDEGEEMNGKESVNYLKDIDTKEYGSYSMGFERKTEEEAMEEEEEKEEEEMEKATGKVQEGDGQEKDVDGNMKTKRAALDIEDMDTDDELIVVDDGEDDDDLSVDNDDSEKGSQRVGLVHSEGRKGEEGVNGGLGVVEDNDEKVGDDLLEEVDMDIDVTEILKRRPLKANPYKLKKKKVAIDETDVNTNMEDENNQRLVKVCIAGKPNVGKSTLINSLLGHSRLLTGPQPGITRDSINIEWEDNRFPQFRFELTDTAGLRGTSAFAHSRFDRVRTYKHVHVSTCIIVFSFLCHSSHYTLIHSADSPHFISVSSRLILWLWLLLFVLFANRMLSSWLLTLLYVDSYFLLLRGLSLLFSHIIVFSSVTCTPINNPTLSYSSYQCLSIIGWFVWSNY